jgi:hypothetical protein
MIALAAALVGAAPARAGDDQVVISGDVKVGRGETLDDVVVVDGNVDVRGRLEGELIALSAPVSITGTVDGDVVALTERAVIGPRARIGGDLIYSDEKPDIAPGARVAGETRRVDFNEITSPLSAFTARLVLWVAMTASTLLLGLALLWLTPRALEAAREMARTRTGPAIGMGMAVFFGLPALAVVLLITLVGIPLGIVLLLALLPIYAIAYTTSAWLLGRAIVHPPTGRVAAFLAGWAILRVIALIPWVGGLAWFGATVFGLGALAIALWRSRRGPVTGAPPAPLAV